ncbi:lipopolysaccharide transport periplasmic protein LptA [Simiduia litorea]|uniref:lipopolysaccharide transport periplasmic protein LptA n=1 Tax=Simiduia litorea TaxID=1435348 RepID=UPI0036F1976E
MPLINAVKGTTLLALTLTSFLSYGLPDDRDQPIQIEADKATQDQNKGITIYTGNVQMDQGSIHIVADKIVIHSAEKKVNRIVATGAPAHFQQKPALDKEVIIARGNTLKYEVVKDKLTITENAQVEQDGSIVTGDIINYDIHLALVEAGSRASNNSRVKMILQPQKKDSDSKE